MARHTYRSLRISRLFPEQIEECIPRILRRPGIAILALWTAGLAYNLRCLEFLHCICTRRTHITLVPYLHWIRLERSWKCRYCWLFFCCSFCSAVAGGDILVGADSRAGFRPWPVWRRVFHGAYKRMQVHPATPDRKVNKSASRAATRPVRKRSGVALIAAVP